MTAPLSPREVAELREEHTVYTPAFHPNAPRCKGDGFLWPCAVVRLLATLDRATEAARREGYEDGLKAVEREADSATEFHRCNVQCNDAGLCEDAMWAQAFEAVRQVRARAQGTQGKGASGGG